MSTDKITPDTPRSYNISLYLQPTGTAQIEARINVTQKPEYKEIAQLANLALYHMASSPKAVATALSIILNVFLHDNDASKAFASLNGEQATPTRENLINMLTTDPPDFVICDIEDNSKGSIRWGLVKRGKTELTSRDEVFISKELCDAIMVKTNLADPQVRRLATFHRAILLFVISYEMMHALVKKTFSPLVYTSPQATLGITDNGGVGARESGFYFEHRYFQFELVAELPKAGLVKGQRLWKISNLLADGNQIYELNDAAVLELIQSFATPRKYELNITEAPIAPPVQAEDTVRWRSCRCPDVAILQPIVAAADSTPAVASQIVGEPLKGLGIRVPREGNEYDRY
ncbi:hypothetical protein B0H17DRAFT_1041334 [Mycena rosella]|uniref:Uncharacterized protein n=1 Tax=Mycena rosella TaxID=1033263 RepID=A0AAD7E0A4_MYCRO|nr:hypothetical protein B0H17DRAFT_1041334 [Mycena rosella]